MRESQSALMEKLSDFGILGIKSWVKSYPYFSSIQRYKKQYLLGFFALVFCDLINVVQPFLVKEGIDAVVDSSLRRVYSAAIAYGLLMALQSLGRYWWRIWLLGTSHWIAKDIRLDLYRHLQRLPLGFYQKVRTGDLMSRATNDIESVRMALGPGILVALDGLVMFALIVPSMFWLSWKLALLTFIFYPLIPCITIFLGNRIDTLFEKLSTELSRLSAYTQESFQGIRLIKALVLEDATIEKFRKLSGQYRLEGTRLAKYEAVFSPALTLIMNLGNFFILVWGGREVYHGNITVGTLVAFQRFVVQLSWPMEAFGWMVTMSREGKAAERRLTGLLKEVPVVSAYAASGETRKENGLSVENLKFGFKETGPEIPFQLQLGGLLIPEGKKIGLVGPVGSGKSTLFQVLLRLYEPEYGAVFWQGKDIKTIPLKDLREEVGAVEQQIVLFSESIRTNIELGAKGEISLGDIQRATEVASIDDEIKELPSGIDSVLGERGLNLSGGQKQRLALVRALIRKPKLLLLDDCFSAVDLETEKKIIERLMREYKDMSILFSSHRLSIMPKMDEIWVVDKGRVVSRGTHTDLLSRDRLYQELWESTEKLGMA